MNKSIIKKYLLIGLIGALITVAGEMAQGYADTVPAADMMIETFATHASVAGWRHGFGSTVGAVGILLQFFGMYAFYLSIEDKISKAAKVFYYGVFNYSFVGASIHILFASAVYVYKIGVEFLTEYMLWFVLPLNTLFSVGFFRFSVAMFTLVKDGRTLFPTWCKVLNPVMGKAVINIISGLMPPSALANGIGYSNMGISAIIIFAVLLMTVDKAEV